MGTSAWAIGWWTGRPLMSRDRSSCRRPARCDEPRPVTRDRAALLHHIRGLEPFENPECASHIGFPSEGIGVCVRLNPHVKGAGRAPEERGLGPGGEGGRGPRPGGTYPSGPHT